MKKIFNAIRDFLYNLTDYGLIISVVFIMSFVLIWRFDILFNRNIDKQAIANSIEIAQIDIAKEQAQKNDLVNPIISNENNNMTSDNPTSNIPTDEQNDIVATIDIPEGTFPSKIGDLLLNSNLIEDKNSFLNRSVEMGLDTKLQSGIFEIAVGTNMDDIIKIIAKAK